MNLRVYTINEYIEEYKRELVSFENLFYQDLIEKTNGLHMIIQNQGMMIKYSPVITEAQILLQLNDEEVNKYAYNPKILSFDLYGTTELWFLLLHANEMYSVSQFSKNPLYVYGGEILNILNSIINLEKPYIDINKEEIFNKIAEIEAANP